MLPADRQNQTFGPLTTGHRVRIISAWSRPAAGFQGDSVPSLLEYARAAHLQYDVNIRAGRVAKQTRIGHYTVRCRSHPADPEPCYASELYGAMPGWSLETLPGKCAATS